MKEVEKISIEALEDWEKIEKNDLKLFEKVKTVADKVHNEDTESRKINLIQEAFSFFSAKEKVAIGVGLSFFGVPVAIIVAALVIPVAIFYGINLGIEKSKCAIFEIKQKKAEKLLDGTISTLGSDANEKFINLLSENLRDRLLRSGSDLEDVNDFVEIKVSTVMDLLNDYAKLADNKENRELLINEIAENLGLSSQDKPISEILKEISDEITHLMHVDRMEGSIGQYTREGTARVEQKLAIHKNLNNLENHPNSNIGTRNNIDIGTRKLRCLIDRPYSSGENIFRSGISNSLFNLRSVPTLITGPINYNQVQFIADIFTNLITEGKSEIFERKGAISAIDAIHQEIDRAIVEQEEKAARKQSVEGNQWADMIKKERLSSIDKSHAH